MAGTSDEKSLSLKIMVDVKAKKVVFAEANKEFIDFIFKLVSLPLSTVTQVLLQHDKGMVGCFGALIKSIESSDTQLFMSNLTSRSVLTPRASVTVPLLALHDCLSSIIGTNKRHYCQLNLRDSEPCDPLMKVYSGYVYGGALYMVKDNLEVKPMSLALIKSHVKEFDVLEEKQVQVGLQEGLTFLKASLETTNVLTTVFLKKI